jgi:uncharacterized Rmd1/YagE family protein
MKADGGGGSPRERRYNQKVGPEPLGIRGFSASKIVPKSSKVRRTAQAQRKNKMKQQANDVQVARVSVYCVGAGLDLSALNAHVFRREFASSGGGERDESRKIVSSIGGGGSTTGGGGSSSSETTSDEVLHVSSDPSGNLWQEFVDRYGEGNNYESGGSSSSSVKTSEGGDNESNNIEWDYFGQQVMSTQDIFYYDYGCVVMWGLSIEEEKAALQELMEFVTDPCTEEELSESCDTLEFLFDHKVNPQRPVRFDRIRLKSLKNSGEKLALSYALAQSSKLFVFESKVLNSLEDTRVLPRELAIRGSISCSKKDLNMLIGQLFVEQTEVNLFSNILDSPDFLWEDDEHSPAYSYLRSYLEVDDRVALLNSRLGVMRELLDVLTSQVENSNSSRLEWIVIVLIAVEIVMGIMSNPLFAGRRFMSALTVPAAILAFKGVKNPFRNRQDL